MPEPLVQNTDARVQQANFNVIEGTEARDDISGTGAADYIIAGGGPDFFVKGGAGKDTFEVNYGDEIVRIADFEVGQDVIALEDRSVLDDATAQEANGRLDVRLPDDTLIRVDGLTLADMEGAFVFRFVTEDELPLDTDPTPDPEPDPEPLVQNTDARVQQANFNVIEGTEARDDISGTGAADYIIAGGGPDFFVKGGAGKDTFEVNYGDEIVRIADFEVGQECHRARGPQRFGRRNGSRGKWSSGCPPVRRHTHPRGRPNTGRHGRCICVSLCHRRRTAARYRSDA